MTFMLLSALLMPNRVAKIHDHEIKKDLVLRKVLYAKIELFAHDSLFQNWVNFNALFEGFLKG